MRLRVIARTAFSRGRTYKQGEIIEIDPTEHNMGAHVRYLKALKKVEEVEDRPVGRVADTRPAPRAMKAEDDAPAPRSSAHSRAEKDDGDEKPASAPAKGRYSRRDLRSED